MTEQDMKDIAAICRMKAFVAEHGLGEVSLHFDKRWCCQMSHPKIENDRFLPTHWDDRLDLAIQSCIAEAHALLLRSDRGQPLPKWINRLTPSAD